MKLNDQQQQAYDEILRFISSKEKNQIFCLKGYAGTGKTSLIGKVVNHLQAKHRNGTEPKSDYAKKCDQVNRHFIGLINEWKKNPNMVYFIENPRGMLRKMPFRTAFRGGLTVAHNVSGLVAVGDL